LFPLSVLADESNSCHEVFGSISIWNGHPPSIRIMSVDGVEMFGIPEEGEEPVNGAIPSELYKLLISSDSAVKGVFCIKGLGTYASVPYSKRKIEFVNVVKYKASF